MGSFDRAKCDRLIAFSTVDCDDDLAFRERAALRNALAEIDRLTRRIDGMHESNHLTHDATNRTIEGYESSLARLRERLSEETEKRIAEVREVRLSASTALAEIDRLTGLLSEAGDTRRVIADVAGTLSNAAEIGAAVLAWRDAAHARECPHAIVRAKPDCEFCRASIALVRAVDEARRG